MKAFLKYYLNPLVLTIGAIGYFSPFFLPVRPGGVSGVLAGNVMLLFVVSACTAWLVAGVQAVMGIVGCRKRRPSWKHHVVSAAWAYACYGIVIALMSNGYYLTA